MGPIVVKLEPNTEHLLYLPTAAGSQAITFKGGELEALYKVLHAELRPWAPIEPADRPLGAEGLVDHRPV